MSNLLQRLLLFFLGVPGLAAIIIFLPHFRHAAVVGAILVFIAGSAHELGRMMRAKGIPISATRMAIAGALPPGMAYLGLFLPGIDSLRLLTICSALFALLLFSRLAFLSKERLETALPEALALAFIVLYPGLLSSFLVLIAAEPRLATEAILGFVLMTFGNDSLAWLVGITLGKKRNIVPVSPNKSLAGFIGGLAGSIIASALNKLLFPAAFTAPLGLLFLMGLAVGIAVIIGDLFESALKRSAGIKDSGGAIPGRGGFLDSCDSLLFAAPVYYGFALILDLFR